MKLRSALSSGLSAGVSRGKAAASAPMAAASWTRVASSAVMVNGGEPRPEVGAESDASRSTSNDLRAAGESSVPAAASTIRSAPADVSRTPASSCDGAPGFSVATRSDCSCSRRWWIGAIRANTCAVRTRSARLVPSTSSFIRVMCNGGRYCLRCIEPCTKLWSYSLCKTTRNYNLCKKTIYSY